jgi:lysophospholipase L1-like esterase
MRVQIRGNGRRFCVGIAALLSSALMLAAVAGPANATDSNWRVAGPRLQTVRVVTTLGDSVPSGAACRCSPYPTIVAATLAARTAPPVRSYDDARSGATTATVLGQLVHSTGIQSHVRASQVVVIEIGANDLGPERRCGTTAACYIRQVPAVVRRASTIVDEVRRLTSGHPVAIVLLGYWNLWRDGRRARAIGSAYVRASDALTLAFNASLRGLARRDATAYGDLWLAFRGTTDRDDTALLAADADHPDAAGHRVIAASVMRVLSVALTRVAYPAVSMTNLARGKNGPDVATYQEALRELLVRVHRLGTLDPLGITSTFDPQTSAMTSAAYTYEAQATRDATWHQGDLGTPGPGLLVALGVRQR